MTDAAALPRDAMPPAGQRRAPSRIEPIGARMDWGSIDARLPNGRRVRLGAGAPVADVDIRDWRALTALAARGDVGWGEAYVAGFWDSEDIETLAAVALTNQAAFGSALQPGWAQRLAFRLTDRLLRRNTRAGSVRNIQAHYDVGDDFYRLWLDPSMTYSSAIFAHPDEDLAEAQSRKYRRLLDVTAGAGPRLLEIGCGWGGFAEAAVAAGREVTAITVSPAQHAYSTNRLAGQADIRLQDYRDVEGQFDAIVSIEMVEAVGERYWPTYFGVLKDRLAAGGRAAIQAIVVEDERFDDYRSRSDFIGQYTFPGGMLLSPEKIRAAATAAGLKAENMFAFGQDYAATLRRWLADFERAGPEIARLGYDESFVRGWRYYLAICAAAFAIGRTDVVQVELRHA